MMFLVRKITFVKNNRIILELMDKDLNHIGELSIGNRGFASIIKDNPEKFKKVILNND